MSWPIVDLTFWSPGEPRSDGIDALLADPSTPLARHGLTGIASAYARETGAALHDVHREWDVHLTGRSLGVDGALAEVVRLFDAHEIPYFIAKGPAIAHTLYPHPGLRPYCDLDVYVPPHADARARALLRSAGYERVHHSPGVLGGLAQEMHGGRYSATVEVHNHVVDNLHRSHLPPLDVFLPHVGREIVNGVSTPTLVRTAHIALQAIHAAAGHRYAKLILLRDLETSMAATDESVPAALGADPYLAAIGCLLRGAGRTTSRMSPTGTLCTTLAASLLRSDPLTWDEYRFSSSNVLATVHQRNWRVAASCATRALLTALPRPNRRVDLRIRGAVPSAVQETR